MAQQNPTKNTFQRVSVMCNKQQEGSSFRKTVVAHDDWLIDVICSRSRILSHTKFG